jgi:hypothetical protein
MHRIPQTRPMMGTLKETGMRASEIFEVIVRTIGLVFVLRGLSMVPTGVADLLSGKSILTDGMSAMASIPSLLIGVVMLRWAGSVVRFTYPAEENPKPERSQLRLWLDRLERSREILGQETDTEQPAGGDWVQPAQPERLPGGADDPLGSDKSTAARYCMRIG